MRGLSAGDAAPHAAAAGACVVSTSTPHMESWTNLCRRRDRVEEGDGVALFDMAMSARMRSEWTRPRRRYEVGGRVALV